MLVIRETESTQWSREGANSVLQIRAAVISAELANYWQTAVLPGSGVAVAFHANMLRFQRQWNCQSET